MTAKHHTPIELLRHWAGREPIKRAIAPLLRWTPLSRCDDGFSIVVGVPWDLRHLLSVNLRFVSRTDLSRLTKLFIVFDRRVQPEMAEIELRIRLEYPELPLEFLHYPSAAGWVIERAHVSTFYNSMNTTLALGRCTTKYAVLHDFDLYPLRPDHFTAIVEAMRKNTWRFSGHELTHFDGLEDQDRQIGTWTLGIDVEWLRSKYRPIDCFHRVATHRGRRFNLDPFAWIQFQTQERGLTQGFDETAFCHVKNLCSTYLRFLKRAPLQVAWRLHYLWYLEELSGDAGRLRQVVEAMNECTDGILHLDEHPADFRLAHASCGNVLRCELVAMEGFLFGGLRPEVGKYLDAFDRFIHRCGDVSVIRDARGGVIWSPKIDRDGARLAGAVAAGS